MGAFGMITQIKAAEYKTIMRNRKAHGEGRSEVLYCKAPNGKYYKTSLTGLAGAKEIADLVKGIKKDLGDQEQLTLL
jgi:hypothetical protein